MRVVHLLGTAQAENAAINGLAMSLRHTLAPKGVTMTAIFMGGAGPLIQAWPDAPAFAWQGAKDLGGHVRLARHLNALKPDLIHQHFGGWPARLVAKLATRAPVLLHLHGRDRESRPHGPLVQTTRGADGVVAVSTAIARDSGDPRIMVVPNGLEAGPQRTAPLDPLAWITASRLVPLRRIHILLELVSKTPGARLTILGDGPARGALEAQAKNLGVADRVIFAGWVEDIGPALRAAGVYLSAAEHEGFGMALAQAMAAGLPLIATKVGGVGELVEDGVSGFLVDVDRPQDFRPRLDQLIKDGAFAARLGAAARARVIDHFTATAMAERIFAVYQDLMSGGR